MTKSDLPVTTEDNHRVVETDGPGADPAFAALVKWSLRTPSATAVSAPDGVLDFRELVVRTKALAAALSDNGVRPGMTVGLDSGRSRLSVPGLLAIWWLGATAVPVDARFPINRTNFMLRDANVEVLLTERIVSGVVPPGVRRVRLSHVEGTPPGPVTPDPDSCAYVIYTSGTTGWPKGVEITYRGLGTFLNAISSLGLTPGGVGLNPLSPAFDGWLWCTLVYLLHGQGTAIIDLEDGEPLDFAARVAAAAPRTVCLPPTLLAACVSAISTVDTVMVAGERCPSGLADQVAVGRRMLNVYGPTEATIGAMYADSARGDDVRSIGRPMPGYAVHVLDENSQPVTEGATGELYIGGPAVARGYRNRPELTAERFVTLPSGERVYRSGDLTTVRPDGLLEFAGRVDDQVKVRGFRVELREVEQVAEELPGVTSAAAFVLQSGDILGLAVIPASGHTLDTSTIRAYCEDRLPAAMVPTTVVVVQMLPVTPTGKIDRDLLARDALTLAPVLAGRGPSTPHELAVCEAWTAVLDRPVTDVDTNFFEVGGHSLLAARAVVALRERTGVRLSMQDLLAHPTPAALARELNRLAATDTASGPASRSHTGSWLMPWSNPAGRPAVLCVPPSGSGCGRYRAWQKELGDAVAVIGVQLPGRENRLADAHPRSLAELLSAVADEVVALVDPDQPLIVFGESFGGLIAYELTRWLGEEGSWPKALVLAACEPPHVTCGIDEHTARVDDELAAAALDEDTRAQVRALVRRDLELTVGYVLPASPGVEAEVHVWGGEDDDQAAPDKLDMWSEFLGSEVARRQFTGGHVFAMHHPHEIPMLLSSILAPQDVPC
ncbi:MAG: amino acid adenylation domain-containing protein [Kibdelosporangium sp.]